MTVTVDKISGFAKASIFAVSMTLAGSALAADPASKQKEPPAPAATPLFDASFGARVVSDYNFRGISQTNRKPGIQSYLELDYWWFYGGIAASSVKLPTKPSAEIDLTYGFRPKFGPLTFDIGMIHYWYPGENRLFDNTGAFWTPRNTDYYEVAGKVSYNWEDKVTVGANVFSSPNWLGTGASGTYYSGTLKVTPPLPIEGISFSGELGHYVLGRTNASLGGINLKDYNYWNAGVSYTYKQATLDLRYHDTNLSKRNCFIATSDPRGINTGSARSNWCGAAFIATLSVDFTAQGLGWVK